MTYLMNVALNANELICVARDQVPGCRRLIDTMNSLYYLLDIIIPLYDSYSVKNVRVNLEGCDHLKMHANIEIQINSAPPWCFLEIKGDKELQVFIY